MTQKMEEMKENYDDLIAEKEKMITIERKRATRAEKELTKVRDEMEEVRVGKVKGEEAAAKAKAKIKNTANANAVKAERKLAAVKDRSEKARDRFKTSISDEKHLHKEALSAQKASIMTTMKDALEDEREHTAAVVEKLAETTAALKAQPTLLSPARRTSPRKARPVTVSVDSKNSRSRDWPLWMQRARDVLDIHFQTDHSRRAVIRELYKAEFRTEIEESMAKPGTPWYQTKQAMSALAEQAGCSAEAALKRLLSGLSDKILHEAIPEEYLRLVSKQAMTKCVSAIQQSWTAHRCLNMKIKSKLSRRKWDIMRKGTACDWDGSKMVRMTLDGVEFPMLPEHRKLVELQRKLDVKYGMNVSNDGRSVDINVVGCIERDISYAIGISLLEINSEGQVVCVRTGRRLQIQFKMDACKLHKGVQQTAVAYTFVNASTNANSPADTRQFCLFENDDHWTSVALLAKRSLAEINVLVAQPVLQLPELGENVSVHADIFGGADLSNLNSMLCIAGCNCACPCPYCEVKKEDCCAAKCDAPERSLDRIRLLAHSAEGVCPGCKMEIKAEVEHPETEMPVAKPGDAVPSTGKFGATSMKKLKTTWAQMHRGVVYGLHPLLSIPIKKWVICLLHMNLRIVGGMFNALVRDRIGKTQLEGQDQAKEIIALFSAHGIWMKESRLKPASKSLNSAQLPKLNFIGVDTEKMVQICEQLMDIIHPKKLRDASSGKRVREQYNKSMLVWRRWQVIWRLLNDALDSTDQEARNRRADAVQQAADEWLVAWVAAHKRTQGLYIHILVHHLAGMVRAYGDLRGFQSQGLEHTHSERKRIALHLTNRRVQNSTTNKRGRTEQTMSFIIAEDDCRKDQRHNLDQQSHKQRANTKIARTAKRVSDLDKQGITKQL